MIARLRRQLAGLARPTSIPAAIAAIVVVLLGSLADRQNTQLVEERQRADVFNQVGLLRARLEGDINGNIQLVRGLAAAIETEPEMTQERFARLAGTVLRERSQIRNIAGAPGLVVRLMYPMQGNEKAIGLDYRRNERQRDAVLRARDSNETILAGPVDLVQGGRGLVARIPVTYPNESGGRTFWGVLSTVIDLERLYRDSGLLKPSLPIDVALVGKDGYGANGELFFGSERILRDDPVASEVTLPSGTWQIAAVPREGWGGGFEERWMLRLLFLVAGAVIVVPTWFIGRLVDERRIHFAKLRERESELERLSRRLELALDTSQIGVWEMDLASGELFWDDRMNELYGYPEDGGARDYSHWRRRLAPDDLDRAEEDFARAMRNRDRYNSQYRLDLGDGRSRIIRAIGKVYVAADGQTKILGVNWDVTSDVALAEDLRRAKALTDARNAELERARVRIEHNSLHDYLTGLPNRMYLDKVLEEHAVRCAHTGEGVALLHVDLDRFKEINDTLGHAAGDAMLIHVANLVRASIAPDDFVARTGGDEFLIISPNADGAGGAEELATRLIAAMQRPASFEGHECRFGISVGIAGAVGAAVDRQRLLVNADIALYRAKNRGRNRYEFFTDALQAEIVSNKQVADSILLGLERGEFVPYFQPQVDARTYELVGVEALARWRHPQRGIVTPNEFVAVAEDLNVLATIDRSILEQSVAEVRRLAGMGVVVPRLSVNVSFRRLIDEGLVDSLRALDFEPGVLAFELVESIYLDKSDGLIEWNIDRIKELGIDIEIDDFGTGYASIVSLTKLSPRRLKIDRQLVVPIVHSQAQRHLVRSIVDIGKSLGIEVVAEGVETMEHARVLRDLGCDVLQGYAFARPMPAEELAVFAAGFSRRAAAAS